MPGAFSKIRNASLYSTVVLSGAGDARRQIDEDNRKAAIIWSIIEIIAWIGCLVLSMSDEIFERCRIMFISALALSIATFVLSAFVAQKSPKLIRPIIFITYAVLLFAGIGISFFQPDVRSATFVAAVLIVPVMFVNDTLPTAACVAASIVIFAIAGKGALEPDIYSWTLKSLIIFSIVGVVIGHIINKTRFERYAFAESAMELAELRNKFAYYDSMTDLLNRRAYTERIEQLAGNMPATCCVVTADVNGLKQINDTLGHSAGDEVIIGAAECLSRCFEGVGDVYRLGGDEFSVITMEPQDNVMQRLLRMKQMAACWKGRFIEGISISYGVATAHGNPNIDSVLRAADRKMYEYKRNYYTTAGRERRRSSN